MQGKAKAKEKAMAWPASRSAWFFDMICTKFCCLAIWCILFCSSCSPFGVFRFYWPTPAIRGGYIFLNSGTRDNMASTSTHIHNGSSFLSRPKGDSWGRPDIGPHHTGEFSDRTEIARTTQNNPPDQRAPEPEGGGGGPPPVNLFHVLYRFAIPGIF